MFVVAAGLVGLLLGVGLSLAADAIAGSHLSEPVPLRIQTDATRSSTPHATASETHDGPKHRDGSDDSSSETPSATTTPASGMPTASATSGEDHSLDASGEHDPPSTEDD
jgi:hypothetical protein